MQTDLGVFDVASWPNAPLHPRFITRVKALPTAYDANTYKYHPTFYFSFSDAIYKNI